MAFSYYMNLEILALEIADENIYKMVDYTDKDFEMLDTRVLQDNIKHGWIVVTMLSSYMESLINTIVRDVIHCDDEKLIKSSLDNKLKKIYLYHKKNISQLRDHPTHKTFKELSDLRNELVHYKYNHIGYGTGLPCDENSREELFHSIITSLTHTNLKDMKLKIIEFSKTIINDCDLSINKCCTFFMADARDGLVSYLHSNLSGAYDDKREDEPPSPAYIKHVLGKQIQ